MTELIWSPQSLGDLEAIRASPMRRDLIVEEVRRNREAIAREHGNDVDAIVAAFQREEAASGVKTVSLRPKRLLKPAVRRASSKCSPSDAYSRSRAVALASN